MYSNDLPLSLKSDTFSALHSDFDEVLRRTIRGMIDTEQDTAEIGVKVKISLTDDSAPDYSVAGGRQTREITKPKFEHTVTAVIQRKEKKTGTLSGEYELVLDSETGKYVMRPIENGQMDLFDEEKDEGGRIINADYTVVNELPEGPRGLPAGSQDDDDDEGTVDTEDGENPDCEPTSEPQEADEDIITPFRWLSQFADQEMRVTEAMGNFTVRTLDSKVVLSSASSPDAAFYCAPDKLEAHVGHRLICTSSTGEEGVERVAIVCESCEEVLFSLEAPAADDEPTDNEEPAVEEDGFNYTDPEEDAEGEEEN